MPAKKAAKKTPKKSAKKTSAKMTTRRRSSKPKDVGTLDKVAKAAKKHGKEIVETVKATPGVIVDAVSKTVDSISETISPTPTSISPKRK